MKKISIPFSGKNIECSIPFISPNSQLFKKSIIHGKSGYKELMRVYDYLIEELVDVRNISKEDVRINLALRMSSLKYLQVCTNVYAYSSLIRNAISWHLSVTKRILEKVKQFPNNKLIKLSELKQWIDYFEANDKISPSLIKKSSIPIVNSIKSDRRTVLNIPQRPIASIQGFAEREYNKQKPYLLVGLMQ